MKRALVLLGAANVVALDCTTQAGLSLGDPSFSWLVSGSSADRKGNITAICASPSNPARDDFESKLSTFQAACVPPGGESSAIALTLDLLNTILCEQKQDNGILHYCVLSVLPLFDLGYFFQLSQSGGNYPPPPLQPVGDDPDRQGTMCLSSVCNAHVEQVASSLLAVIPPSSPLAAQFIRNVVSRTRCGCAVEQVACQNTAMTNALTTASSTGARTFIESQACDANGVLTACARTWVNCENVPLPACAHTCTPGHSLANITFVLKNLDYTCLQTQLTTNVLQTVQSDVIVNVAGLLQTDFSCTCGAATGTNTGTQCNCLITCAALNVVKNLNLPKNLGNLTKHADALVIPTPNLDKQVIASCQITQNNESFGSSFQILSLETNFPAPTENSASTLIFGMSFVASICFNLVL